jgi:formylglycine-generating enzyme
VPSLSTVRIPGGCLEAPGARGARIAAFRLGRTAVTNREYAEFLASGRAAEPPWWNDPSFSGPIQPVVGVTWHEAVAFADWLSEAVGGRWRLPTEAEWELAMSGGRAAPRTAWGDAIPAGEIPDGPLAGPWNAGCGTPNPYGVCDPGTIVHEWCLDRREPVGPGALARRASRGGSWRHRVRWSAPSASSSLPPDYRYSDYGIRVLREEDAE